MTTRATLRLEEQLCFALYSASRVFTRAYAPLLAEIGLTYPQYVAMLALWEHDDVSVSELGERLTLDSGTLTPLLKRLEEAGLVTRTRSDEDERVVRITLTRAGKKLEARAAEIPTSLACRAGYAPTREGLAQLGQLRDALKDITKTLQATLEPQAPAPKPRAARA